MLRLANLFILHVFGHLMRIKHAGDSQLVTTLFFLGLFKLLLTLLQIQVGVIVASHFLKIIKKIEVFVRFSFEASTHSNLNDEISQMLFKCRHVMIKIEEASDENFDLIIGQMPEC